MSNTLTLYSDAVPYVATHRRKTRGEEPKIAFKHCPFVFGESMEFDGGLGRVLEGATQKLHPKNKCTLAQTCLQPPPARTSIHGANSPLRPEPTCPLFTLPTSIGRPDKPICFASLSRTQLSSNWVLWSFMYWKVLRSSAAATYFSGVPRNLRSTSQAFRQRNAQNGIFNALTSMLNAPGCSAKLHYCVLSRGLLHAPHISLQVLLHVLEEEEQYIRVLEIGHPARRVGPPPRGKAWNPSPVEEARDCVCVNPRDILALTTAARTKDGYTTGIGMCSCLQTKGKRPLIWSLVRFQTLGVFNLFRVV